MNLWPNSKAHDKQRRQNILFMKKLILKNLQAEQLNKTQLKDIYGGYQCSDYYCEFVNPQASCCGGSSGGSGSGGSGSGGSGSGGSGGGGYQCSSYYCTFINPNAVCCY